MSTPMFVIHEDITRAATLPARFYSSPEYFVQTRDTVFVRSWQFVTDSDRLQGPAQVLPWTVLPGYLDEPIVLTRAQDDRIHCLANVCTHRGAVLVDNACHAHALRCRYHGRRFRLDGICVAAPGFEETMNFPGAEDHLSHVPFGLWNKFLFAAITPAITLDDVIAPMRERLSWLPLTQYEFDSSLSREYLVPAHWALYCDNYLEGLHIPYVHPALAAALDMKDYRYEIYPYSTLQIGMASRADTAFHLPASSPDYGQAIAAYYYWLFPNMMFNFYPWGLSINLVTPLAINRTRVSFLTYVWDRTRLASGAGADLNQTEQEDEDIVENIQRGLQSHFYDRGRYAPRHEQGVHHFHRLLTRFLTA